MRVVYVTAPADAAPKLARALVEAHLAACVNIVPAVRSIYTWDGKIEDDTESWLIIKTTDHALPALTARVKELHPYKVPEVIALAVDEREGNPDYIDWVNRTVTGG